MHEKYINRLLIYTENKYRVIQFLYYLFIYLLLPTVRTL